MFKKAFTLVEIVIVVLIIWILFWAIWYLSWSYVYRLNIQNDQEAILSTFQKVQSISLSQPVVKNKVLSYVWIKLIPNKKYLLEVWTTWNVYDYFSLQAIPLYYLSMGSGFYILSWWNKTFISWSGVIFYKSYWIWASFLCNWNIYSGNKIVEFQFEDNKWREKVCFKLDLLSGRIFEKKCK